MKLTIVCILLCSTSLLFGQQVMKQKIEMDLDAQGSANITVSMTMDASSWQGWLATYGNNPAVFKREMERDMPAFFLDDFTLEKDEMERSWTLKVKAYGVCKVDKRGNWILETDDKNIDLTELNEKEYMYVTSPLEFGGQVQQSNFIRFPKESSNIKIDKDALGKTIFKFEMKKQEAGFGIPGWVGVGLILIGSVLFFLARKKTGTV
ncbi:MAG: hypothetical protein IPH61_02060 [Bacteroidetes bacterium]|nr:hypothetical protein [Bacteroidota bacterium]